MDLPSNITAWTGMDAVTHALEALLVPPVPKNLPATGFHPLCDGAALQALRAINNNLEQAVKHGKEDIVSRAEMQVAAALAGRLILNHPTMMGIILIALKYQLMEYDCFRKLQV